MIAVSVIMSVYSEPIDWLRQSINSILEQSFQDFEFIIILDNPTYEEGARFLKEIEQQNSKVRLLINDVNLGLTKSLNIGLKNAQGKYIARMDADDISYPDRFQKQFEFMEKNTDIVACGTAIRRFGIKEKVSIFPNDPEDISVKFAKPRLPIAHPTAFIRREVLTQHNITYNEDYRTAQDYGLWSDLLFVGKLSNLTEVLLDYRMSKNQITSTKRKEQLITVNKIVAKHIAKWLKINYPTYQQPITLENILKLRDTASSPSELVRFRSFSQGLVKDRTYNTFYTMRYLFTDRNIGIPLKAKLKIVVKKFLGR